MKYFTIILSAGITLVIFSMSLTSGSSSAELSFSFTNTIYDFLSNLFPNINIDIDQLHIIIRKSAHIFEYSILSVSWYITFKTWKWSFVTLLLLGLVIASIDESIQILADDRGPSIIDVLIFDYLPFTLISLTLYSLNNKKGDIAMLSNTLTKLQDNTISPEVAYEELYKKKKSVRVPFFRRAHFIKLRVVVPGEKGVNTFLKILFALPISLLFLRILLSFVKLDKYDDDMPFTKRELINLVSHRGVLVQVNTKSGEKILIKTI